jgi:hypothetical protein
MDTLPIAIDPGRDESPLIGDLLERADRAIEDSRQLLAKRRLLLTVAANRIDDSS